MTPYEAVREEFDFPFELYPFQVESVNELGRYDRVGFYWEPGCVDSDTEYLTPTGWRKISEYDGGVVGQFDPFTDFVSFVEPLKYVKEPCAEMVRIKTKYGLDQLLSSGHKVLLYRGDRLDRGHSTVSAKSLLVDHDRRLAKIKRSWTADHISFSHAAIKTTFKVAGGSGIDLTDDQLRLQIAVMADGHFGSSINHCVVRVKKERKVERLRVLLDQAGVEYRERLQNTATAKGFHVFSFNAPLRLKEFDDRFWAATPDQINLIAVEVTMWDSHWTGGNKGVRFSSVSKQSADFVQYVWTVTGRTTSLSVDKRSEKYKNGVCYEVGRRGPTKGLLHLHNRREKTMWLEPSTDGFKYCFNVPTGFLVLRRNGCIFTTGNTGKTAGTTHWTLHKSLTEGIDQWVIIMPPILLLQWERWLKSVKWHNDGESPTVCVYAGTPKQRNALSLDCDFTLMSYVIFKNDYQRLMEHFSNKSIGVVCDEGHAVKNISSQNHKAVRDFAVNRPLAILTGTPLTTPMDAYAYVKLIAPGVYRNMRQFENIHVKERDSYGTITQWDNLDLLADNMRLQTSRILRREVQSQLPAITFTTMPYNLASAHHKLYERIATEKLVEFEDGREINAISTQALYSALQQVIINWADFEEDDTKEPAALELVDEVFDEIGPDAKLVVVANFIRSNSYLSRKLKKYGAVAVYGEISSKNKQAAIRSFTEDPSCRCILLQPQSAGFGIDGLQHVCSDMLVLEAPTTAPPFYQVTARLDRDGQKNPVNCRIAVANRTVQVRMFKRLLENDATINSIQGGYKDLKDAIYGD